MSARVHPKCGHVYHMVEVVRLENHPHIHLHFLTSEDEYKFLEYLKLEACCHGCGGALLMYYEEVEEEDVDIRTQICDEFREEHAKCPNRGFEKICLNYRSKIDFLDLRHGGEDESHSNGDGDSESEAFGPAVRWNDCFATGRTTVRG